MRFREMGIMAFLMVLLIGVSNVDAKWWIFGASQEEVELKYLTINGVSFSEMGPAVTLYRDTLPDGMIKIKGRATATDQQDIKSVRITIDNKQSWIDTRLNRDGSFEYGFSPEVNKPYGIFVEITDSAGKKNNSGGTYKEVVVSDRNIYGIVKDTIDRLIDAYQRENPGQFMDLVSEDFTANRPLLDRAIRKDFSAFDNISLRLILNNVTVDASGKILVIINYNRVVTSTKSGGTFSDYGTTEFTFKIGDRGLKLFTMKWPLIFGLSDASNVAQGTVSQTANTNVLIVDPRGNVALKPYNESVAFLQAGGTTVVITKSIRLSFPALPSQGLKFSTDTKTSEPAPSPAASVVGDVALGCGGFQLATGVAAQDLGYKSIDAVTEAPSSGYSATGASITITQGHSYAFRMADGKYAVVEVINFSFTIVACNPRSVMLRYKYQPNGSRTF